VNGIIHIAAGIVRLSYNPGLLTAVILFIPLSLHYYKEIKRQYEVNQTQISFGIAYAIVLHMVLGAALVLVYARHAIPESLYVVSFMITAAFPFVIGLLGKDQRTGLQPV
jgi:hypothetical protein